MLGYLNAPDPFTADGWFNTEDLVEVDGEYLKFLGRESDVINVGGAKVYPAEIESVIQEMDNVAEAAVYSEVNAIIGNIVCVKVRLIEQELHSKFVRRLRSYCSERLERFKVPIRVVITDRSQHSGRFKKVRQVVS
jgi:acyl-CoA synthetase (AMP-forming)/AMP-acid ligase II